MKLEPISFGIEPTHREYLDELVSILHLDYRVDAIRYLIHKGLTEAFPDVVFPPWEKNKYRGRKAKRPPLGNKFYGQEE